MQKGLLLLFISLISMSMIACSGGGESSDDPTSQPAPAPPVESSSGGISVKMVGKTGEYKYEPAVFKFKSGETVTFTLISDSELHTFTVESLGVDESVAANEKHTFSITFNTAGEFKVVCIPHPEMTAKITVE